MVGLFSLVTGRPGPTGYGSATTAEQVTEGIDASELTVLITGGASGIGAETARVFALRGAHVIIAARNMEAANYAKKLILESIPNANIDAMKLDLSSLESVRTFADNFIATGLPLNILINNAGVMFCAYQLSANGVELQFATNHLGHFYLTNLLLAKIKSTAKETGTEGRIVNLSSIAHHHTYAEGIQFDGLNDESRYNDKKAYGQSKLANILHANELSRRLQINNHLGHVWLGSDARMIACNNFFFGSHSLATFFEEEGANVTVNSVHPGLIMTNLMRHSILLMKILKIFTYMFWKNVPQGAATSCYVALHPSLKGVTGRYFLDCNEMNPSNLAVDAKLAKKLWDFSEGLVKSAQTQ